MIDQLKLKGRLEMELVTEDRETGELQTTYYKCNNAVLRRGREALAASLAGPSEDLYISRMLFGDGGTTDGVPKVINTERNGLFGTVRATKVVISSINPQLASEVVFTSVLTYDDANGYHINELGLRMQNNDLYSMATFPGFSKTSSMQVTMNWIITFV